MNKWEKTRFGEIIKTNTHNYSPNSSWNYVNYLDTGSITENEINCIQFINLTKEKLPSRARRMAKNNSIVYSSVRPNQRHYGIIKNQPKNFIVSTGFIVIDVDEEKADADYIYFFLSQNTVVEELQALAEQSVSTYPSIKPSDIENLEIILPPIDTQKKIAGLLKSITSKIESNISINQNLEQQAQTVFKSWFVEYEPFDDPLVETPAGFQAPASLKMIQIADIPHILETGRRPKGGAVSNGIPSIGAENVKRLGEVNLSSAKFIPVDFAKSMKTGKVNGYELMLYKDGGKPGTFIPHFSMFGEGFPYDDFFINEHVFKLDFFDRGYNEFVYFYMQTDYPYSWLSNNGGKAAVPGINQQDVNSIWIFSPDNIKVREFNKWVQPIFTKILCNCAQNVQLAKLRDTLLPKLMSGELDVSNIDF